METKSTLALLAALTLGTASNAFAKSHARHTHPYPSRAYAAPFNARAEAPGGGVRPFTPEEKALFDRASKLF